MSESSVVVWILASVLVALIAVLAVYVIRLRRLYRAQLSAAEQAAPKLVDFDPIAPCHASSWLLEDQPFEWRNAMASIGTRLERARIAEIIFVHGTLVGDDPLAVGSVVKRALPSLPRSMERALQRVVKAGSNRILGDLGNYAPEYVALFEAALGKKIPCSSFVWSSANHHIARVRAAIWLAQRLASSQSISDKRRRRVLLIGHSHAGQIFALLTQLMAGGSQADLLLEAVRGHEEDETKLRAALSAIRELQLDIVTMGTAPRYAWGDARTYRVAHVVNHRPGDPAPHPLRAIIETAHGDYVQKIGVAGSDFPAWTDSERRINLRLDQTLGPGFDPKAWLNTLRSGAASHMPSGTTLLVRYRDVSVGAAPKIVDTYFGHGVYTRKGAMLFTLKLVTDHFYPARVREPLVLLTRVQGVVLASVDACSNWVSTTAKRFETRRQEKRQPRIAAPKARSSMSSSAQE